MIRPYKRVQNKANKRCIETPRERERERERDREEGERERHTERYMSRE